ncbi:HAD-IIB family hydrolase [Fodinibius salsisoli]|uniref:HAD-IIB family hydrolase n=1 Tax=Fodinibius salsisoli TaxID=2820877 RepID=A0ABT3PKU6_9BACT|nr:HAD-IIB family hydrolase [Fodinibius salsisoli]MCW9706563.1 HAD-IIB family hydrolase [Fodinibius salsisoli]
MIKLFVTDLDGCISVPFQTPDWQLLSEIRRLNEQHVHDRAVPPLTICSGRPQPYVEAVAQWLNVQHPAGFENAGIYNVQRNELELLPAFNEEAAQQVKELKEWLQREIVDRHSGMIVEFTKKMDAGVIHSDKEAIDAAFPVIEEYVAENYSLFEVHKTDVSVNVILANNNKGNGILKLCELLDIDPEEVAYIGDSSGDIPGLKIVGQPYAPLNASDAVKACAEVLDAEVTEAVLMAYRRIIQRNREQLSKKISNQAS